MLSPPFAATGVAAGPRSNYETSVRRSYPDDPDELEAWHLTDSLQRVTRDRLIHGDQHEGRSPLPFATHLHRRDVDVGVAQERPEPTHHPRLIHMVAYEDVPVGR